MRLLLADTQIGSRTYPDCDLPGLILPSNENMTAKTISAADRSTHLSNDQLLSLYRSMVLIRRCEEQLARSHQRGLVHGACHTYVGQEAIAAGVCAHLRADDVVFSTHRGHGHALAKGVPPRQLFAELFGRATGC